MIPIGIVTRNRHTMLDVTLRSLSASDLPADQQVVVFDDASNQQSTKDYLYTDKPVFVGASWPRSQRWRDMDLDQVRSRNKSPGLDGKVRVIRLGRGPSGVVNASCQAFCRMVESFGRDHGIIIMQDDVVFNADWMARMTTAAQEPEPNRRPVGLVAGCWINKKNSQKRSPMTYVPHGGVTAQCYYVTPEGIKAVLPWASRRHNMRMGFDNKFCAHVRSACDIYRMHPAVCQHIGLASLVRPSWRWTRWHSKGRVDFSARGPFPLAATVRSFK